MLAQPRGYPRPQIMHVACMAHVRRELRDVFEATKSKISEEALHRVAALYAIEAEINDQPAQRRLAVRQARSKPPLADLHEWMLEQLRQLSGKSSLGKVMRDPCVFGDLFTDLAHGRRWYLSGRLAATAHRTKWPPGQRSQNGTQRRAGRCRLSREYLVPRSSSSSVKLYRFCVLHTISRSKGNQEREPCENGRSDDARQRSPDRDRQTEQMSRDTRPA